MCYGIPMNVHIKSYLSVLFLLMSMHSHAEAPASESLLDKVENLYSEAELKAKIAVADDALQCADARCEENLDFDTKIQQFGLELSERAYAKYQNLKKDVPEFAFSVAEKSELALASNKLGHVVVFRGVQDLSLSDNALKFLLAREMAHVIAKHHDKNISTKLLISALTAVAFPAVAIVAANQAAAEVSTVTSIVTSAASTATSLVGSEVAIARLKPRQLLEADKIAFELTQEDNVDLISLSAELNLQDPQTNWEKDLLKTQDYLAQQKDAQSNIGEVDLNYKNALQDAEQE